HIPVERGRTLTDRDDEHAPAVVLIDATFARKYFPNENPIGKHVNVGLIDIQPEIIGVVGHVEHWGLGSREHQNLQAQIYLPVWQVPDRFWPLLAKGGGYVARTAGGRLGGVSANSGAVNKTDNTAGDFSINPNPDILAK